MDKTDRVLWLVIVTLLFVGVARDIRTEYCKDARERTLYVYADLKTEIANKRAQVVRIRERRIQDGLVYLEDVRWRKEHPEFSGIQNPNAFSVLEDVRWERIAREQYDRLLCQYNQLQNVNYGLLGSSPLAATLHMRNDLPQDLPDGLPVGI